MKTLIQKEQVLIKMLISVKQDSLNIEVNEIQKYKLAIMKKITR